MQIHLWRGEERPQRRQPGKKPQEINGRREMGSPKRFELRKMQHCVVSRLQQKNRGEARIS